LEEQGFLQKLCKQTPIVRNETIRIHQMTIEHLLTSGTPPVYIKTRHDPLIPTENQPRRQKKTREKKKITSLETVADRSVTTERKPVTKHNPKERAHNRDDLLSPTQNTRRKEGKRRKQYLPTKERTRKMISTAVKLDHAQHSLASEGTARNSKTLITSLRIQR
jgi:hypothetical protein